MAKLPKVSQYDLLFEVLKQQGVFEGYREGVKALGDLPPNIPPATIERAKEKILDVTLASLAQKSPALLKMLKDAAFEVLVKKLYQDVKNGVDQASKNTTPGQLFNELWKGHGKY